MKEINIKVSNISSKQWPLLLVELNLVAKEWKKYGPKIDIKAKNFDKILNGVEKNTAKNNGFNYSDRWSIPFGSSD